MTPLLWSELKAFTELRRYPGLLARMSRMGTPGASVPIDQALQDVLEPGLADSLSVEQRVKCLLDDGELGAARLLAEISGVQLSPNQLARASAKYTQDSAAALRDVMGRLLILKDTRDVNLPRISRAVSLLKGDDLLREARPGRLLALLKPLATELDVIANSALQRVRRESALIAMEAHPQDGDYAIALGRLKEAVGSLETLPRAEQLLAITNRLRTGGQLGSEDIRSLHTETPSGGNRLTRRRTEYPQQITQAVDVLAFIEEQGEAFPWTSSFDKDKARDLFKSLIPHGGAFSTDAIARRLTGFLGLKSEPSQLEKLALGSTLRVRIPSPRIPAFRSGDRAYPLGIQMVLPLRADESTIPALLNGLAPGQLPIVYFPGRTERLLRQQFSLNGDAAHLDNIDLLRLAECSLDQRPHALQQLLLTRLSISPLKPYQKGGPVSPEMFRGRGEIVDKLKQPKGGTVLFSGRMMGKSSILHKIHDDIQSKPVVGARRDACVFVSSAADDLFTPLINRLVEVQSSAYRKYEDADRKLGPLSTLSPSERKERHKKRLQNLRALVKAVLANGHLTVLIDEADKFAAADGERPREESLAWLLRDLEMETPDRLRIVFAGFQTIHHQALFKNGAFANWFGLEQLGPLDTPDAAALVREPFADFGFLFASDAGVERILEFTGRHPLLVQEVCLRLMERVASRRRSTTADEFIAVEAGDVETVCRDDQLRDRVRQVLSLNLDDYPRLKLMVYLILFAASATTKRLTLESFRLEDLKEILIEFYGDRFNDHFDERSIGALVQELMALGLLSRQGDSYAFANYTFAHMLQEDRQFDKHLMELLSRVTEPDREGSRRFVTLSDEDLERLLRPSDKGQAILVAGLPGTARTFIANRLFNGESAADAVLLDASGCRSRAELLELLRNKLSDKRKGLSIADLAVKSGIATLALDGVDELARNDQIKPVLDELSQRGVRLISFGGPDLVRCYVRSLLALGTDLVPLRRLSAADVRSWGEHASRLGDAFQIILDEQTSGALEQTTGGYLPLIARFADHLRKTGPNKREFIPDALDVRVFGRDLTLDAIKQALLDPLNNDERAVLSALYSFAIKEGMWEIEWGFVTQDVLPGLFGTDSEQGRWLDAYEVVRLLDLVSESSSGGARRVTLIRDGPLHRIFRGSA